MPLRVLDHPLEQGGEQPDERAESGEVGAAETVLLIRGQGHSKATTVGELERQGDVVRDAFVRELLEETGLKAGRLLPLYSGNSLTSYLEGTLHIYFAGDCAWTGKTPDPDEENARHQRHLHT